MTREHASNVTFPAVTICNLNLVHCRNLNEHILELNKTGGTGERVYALCNIYILGKCSKGLIIDDIFKYGDRRTEEVCLEHPANKILSNVSGVEDESLAVLITLMDQLPVDDQIAIAHRPDQMFKLCTFQNLPNNNCADLIAGHKKFLTPAAGICYSFNYHPPGAESADDSELEATLSGEKFGLDLEVDIQSGSSLLRGLTRSAGIQV